MELDTEPEYELALTDKCLLFAIAPMHIFGTLIYISSPFQKPHTTKSTFYETTNSKRLNKKLQGNQILISGTVLNLINS